jgi:hypothetical protein
VSLFLPSARASAAHALTLPLAGGPPAPLPLCRCTTARANSSC